MLTLLHSFLESYIDPYFAEIVYNWNELVLSIIGGVSTIVSSLLEQNSFHLGSFDAATQTWTIRIDS